MARALLDELSADIDIWNMEHPFVAVADLSADKQMVELKVVECPPAPLAHWSATLGNAIASLRAAADSFAWQIAHLDGHQAPSANHVYFPMAPKPSDWKKRINALGQIHPDLVQRFEELRESDDGWLSMIVAIAKLNNVDKHRSALRISPDFERASMDDLRIDFQPNHGGMRSHFEPILDLQTVGIGDVVARLRFSAPIS